MLPLSLLLLPLLPLHHLLLPLLPLTDLVVPATSFLDVHDPLNLSPGHGMESHARIPELTHTPRTSCWPAHPPLFACRPWPTWSLTCRTAPHPTCLTSWTLSWTAWPTPSPQQAPSQQPAPPLFLLCPQQSQRLQAGRSSTYTWSWTPPACATQLARRCCDICRRAMRLPQQQRQQGVLQLALWYLHLCPRGCWPNWTGSRAPTVGVGKMILGSLAVSP